MLYTRFNSPLCEILLAGDDIGLTHVHLYTGKDFPIPPTWQRNDTFFTEAKTQILAYLDGQRNGFDLPLNPQGTAFQQQVWEQLRLIPYGQTRSYKDLALALGKPNGSRAVGLANGKNPLPILIPCHRVIAANGHLTGFAFGLETKAALLKLENPLFG